MEIKQFLDRVHVQNLLHLQLQFKLHMIVEMVLSQQKVKPIVQVLTIVAMASYRQKDHLVVQLLKQQNQQ